jgi:hypothetical protein
MIQRRRRSSRKRGIKRRMVPFFLGPCKSTWPPSSPDRYRELHLLATEIECAEDRPQITRLDISKTEGKELPSLTEVNGDASECRERLSSSWKRKASSFASPSELFPRKISRKAERITLLSGMQAAEEFSRRSVATARSISSGSPLTDFQYRKQRRSRSRRD